MPSLSITALALLPATGMLVLFYSLAIHTHRSLGGWPTTIGTHGFPPSLVTHSNLAFGYFAVVLMLNLVAWPTVTALCVFIRRWRIGIYYLGVYALSFVAAFGAMLLAPSPFLYWWWD
ncbi:MAG: hypothetical protein KDA22_06920 [Phycisphaerales bacterium]|nr:hypothetical protein [Phycisphaerales bacterium]